MGLMQKLTICLMIKLLLPIFELLYCISLYLPYPPDVINFKVSFLIINFREES